MRDPSTSGPLVQALLGCGRTKIAEAALSGCAVFTDERTSAFAIRTTCLSHPFFTYNHPQLIDRKIFIEAVSAQLSVDRGS